MRKTYRKKNFEKINKQIIITGFVFIVFVVLGTYLNKIWEYDLNNLQNNVNPILKYYSSDIIIKDTILSNFKSDLGFMGLMCLSTLFIITAPLAVIIFIVKGLSIGYTINSCILTLKIESIKIIFIVLIKNIIIIPGIIILALISLSYFTEVIPLLKKASKENILFLSKRYLLNSILVITISVVLQLLLNTVSINIIKFLVR